MILYDSATSHLHEAPPLPEPQSFDLSQALGEQHLLVGGRTTPRFLVLLHHLTRPINNRQHMMITDKHTMINERRWRKYKPPTMTPSNARHCVTRCGNRTMTIHATDLLYVKLRAPRTAGQVP